MASSKEYKNEQPLVDPSEDLDTAGELQDCYTYVGGGCTPAKPIPASRCVELTETGLAEVDTGPFHYEGHGQCSTGSPVGLWPVLLVCLIWVRRLQWIGLVLLCVWMQSAAAFDAQRLQILEGGRWVALREADFGEKFELRLASGLSFAQNPLVRKYASSSEVEIGMLGTAEMGLSVNVGAVQFGVGVPVHGVVGGLTPARLGVGDVATWAGARFPLQGERGHLALMTRLEGLSDMEHLSGEAFVGTLAYEYQASSWGFAANAGYRVQSYLEIPEDRWGHRFEYGAGVHWTPGRFGVKGEMLGSIPVYAFKEGGQFPLEVLGSGHGEITPHLRVHLGAGVGVSRGIGSPKLRLFSMLEWRPDLSKDNDRDGIVNVRDWCPNRPEDMDEFRDKNGCPDLDNDRDQVLDVEDACPLIPETYNEYLDEDGCPDIAGQVLVQVVGEERGSISVARVTAGERASIRVIEGDVLTFPVYGPVLTVNVEAEGHYPMRRVAEIEQNGEETVLVFRLQQIPENATGTPFDDSFLEALTLELEQSMEFELDSAVLGEEDWASLDELAAYLNAHLEIRLIRVEGFADEVGASAYNYDLSQRRAEAVYAYLVDKGVARHRMQPIATGEALRSQHPVAVRRVEFTVLIWADPENESAPSLPEGAP